MNLESCLEVKTPYMALPQQEVMGDSHRLWQLEMGLSITLTCRHDNILPTVYVLPAVPQSSNQEPELQENSLLTMMLLSTSCTVYQIRCASHGGKML